MFTKEQRIKGGKKTRKLYGKDMDKKLVKRMKAGLASRMGKIGGKRTVLYEKLAIEQNKDLFDEIFRPRDICDRVAVKNGKIIFIECKRVNQSLRKNQDKFKKLCDKAGIEYNILVCKE